MCSTYLIGFSEIWMDRMHDSAIIGIHSLIFFAWFRSSFDSSGLAGLSLIEARVYQPCTFQSLFLSVYTLLMPMLRIGLFVFLVIVLWLVSLVLWHCINLITFSFFNCFLCELVSILSWDFVLNKMYSFPDKFLVVAILHSLSFYENWKERCGNWRSRKTRCSCHFYINITCCSGYHLWKFSYSTHCWACTMCTNPGRSATRIVQMAVTREEENKAQRWWREEADWWRKSHSQTVYSSQVHPKFVILDLENRFEQHS